MMNKKFELADIKKAILDNLNTPTGKVVETACVSISSAVNPVVGGIMGIGSSFLSEYDNFKFDLLLKGLSSGLNTETHLNELYNYVNAGQDNAIAVANMFRKTINAESPKTCIIYGLILSDIINNKTYLSQDELMICRALENATDYDLDIFKEIMGKYMKETENGTRTVVFPKDFELIKEYLSTCDWAVYNRIFISNQNSQLGELKQEEEMLDLNIHYYESSPAPILLGYIEQARQIWCYSFKSK